jgi:hypothetical protein
MQRVIMKTNITILAAALLLVPSLALADDTVPEKRPANIVVHVATPDAVLRGHTSSGQEIACDAPCNQAVPADLEYYLSTNTRTSNAFGLQRDSRKVNVALEGTSHGHSAAGIALAILGGVTAITGATLFAYGAMDHTQYGVTGSVSEAGIFVVPTATNVGQYRDVMIGGGIAMGIGAVALVSGLVLAITTKKAQVVQTAITF